MPEVAALHVSFRVIFWVVESLFPRNRVSPVDFSKSLIWLQEFRNSELLNVPLSHTARISRCFLVERIKIASWNLVIPLQTSKRSFSYVIWNNRLAFTK